MNIISIADWNLPALDIYHKLSEPQLLHYYEPADGLFIAESPNVIERALAAGYCPVSILMEEKHLEWYGKKVMALAGDIPVYTASQDVMDLKDNFLRNTLSMTRGVLCAMKRRPLPQTAEILSSCHRVAVLEEVVNPTNVGAIFRSAAALGMDAVLLSAGSADPLYRRAARVSMGTVFQIPWTYFAPEEWPADGLSMLHSHGFHTVAMALRENTRAVNDPFFKGQRKLAVVLGTEGEGLMEETISGCRDTVMIPMYHGVDSLNVAAASAVAFWELGSRQERNG